jgi:aromatic ring-cleaving dioxygenase
VQSVKPGTEKELGVFSAHVAADEQKSADDFRERQRLGERANGLLVGRRGEDPVSRPYGPL